LRESRGSHHDAASLFETLQSSFPAYEHADEALWRAGLAYYQAGNIAQAITTWEALQRSYKRSDYRTKALYWLGKVGSAPASSAQQGYWEQLTDLFGGNYYALRVQQIEHGTSITATRLVTEAIEPPTWSTEEYEAAVSPWLARWTDVPTGTSLVTLAPAITRRNELQRGEAFLSAGLRVEALGAYNDLLAWAWNEPVALAQLAPYFRRQGFHGLAARCAVRVAGLRPGQTIHDSPKVLRQLAYPLAYADLLSREAQARGLDPLLLAALVRQESLFEPVAESYAGARGLGQVMPATGEGIARSLDMAEFVLADLYRPWVSLRFAAFYLGAQMKRFDNQLLVALAAYNGGPGNTLRWLEGSGQDVDLFVEVITASQSRIYLQRVYEQYIIYEELYRS
jgi:soluble lytic murein transglycosylase